MSTTIPQTRTNVNFTDPHLCQQQHHRPAPMSISQIRTYVNNITVPHQCQQHHRSAPMSTTIPQTRTNVNNHTTDPHTVTDVDDMNLHNYLSAGETKSDTTDYWYAEKSTTTLQVLHPVTDHTTETQEDTLLLLKCCFTSTETVGLSGTGASTGRPPRLSHSS